MRHEVRFSGYGGQGIILSSVILGRAAALYDGKYAVQTQVYGRLLYTSYAADE